MGDCFSGESQREKCWLRMVYETRRHDNFWLISAVINRNNKSLDRFGHTGRVFVAMEPSVRELGSPYNTRASGHQG